MGWTEIKKRPQRVVVLDIAEPGASAASGEKKPTVSMVRYMPGTIRLYAKASFIGTVLQDVGVPRPRDQQVNDLATEIGSERMDEADADWIFTGAYGDPKKTDRATVRDSPLWKKPGFVKNRQAKDIDET